MASDPIIRRHDMLNTPELAIRELDHRTSDCIEVRLLWNSRTDAVSVAVEDGRSGEAFLVEVPGSDALYAFHHPYAYVRGEAADRALSSCLRCRSSSDSASASTVTLARQSAGRPSSH